MIRAGNYASSKRQLQAIAILALLLSWSCAYAATPRCESRAARTQESIPAQTLASWEPLDDHSLLVWTAHDSRAHLVRLERPIPGLRGAPIVFLVTRDHARTVCACGHDEVMVPGGGSARIISIRYLSEKRTAELDTGGLGTSRVSTTLT